MVEKDAIEHHGIKGMKWGVRRTKVELQSKGVTLDGERSVVTLHPTTGKVVSASPNLRSKPTDDAVAASLTKARIKTQSLDVVSNKELQHLVNRMNLEQQYARLSTSAVSDGQRRVKNILAVGNTANEIMKFKNSPAGKSMAVAFKAAKVVA